MNETIEYKIITDINALTLAKFEDCLCDQKLSVLVISGNPSDIDLIECWSNLYAQYLDILGDSETMYLVMLEWEVEFLEYKITTGGAIVKVLEFFHIDALVQELKRLRFETKNLVPGSPHYSHALAKVLSKIQFFKLKLEEKQNELKQYAIEDKEAIVTRIKLQQQRARLSKFQGYPIKPTKTYVPEYVAILKEYLSHYKLKEDGDQQKR
jgi:hypothetical protein